MHCTHDSCSIQCVVPPYIDSTAPHEKRGVWLAIFYIAGPLGTALGYAWGGILGSSALTWRAAFLLEPIPVLLCLPLFWFAPYHRQASLLHFMGVNVSTPL
jgi:predicted MFS family arabinose efflux permease